MSAWARTDGWHRWLGVKFGGLHWGFRMELTLPRVSLVRAIKERKEELMAQINIPDGPWTVETFWEGEATPYNRTTTRWRVEVRFDGFLVYTQTVTAEEAEDAQNEVTKKLATRFTQLLKEES